MVLLRQLHHRVRRLPYLLELGALRVAEAGWYLVVDDHVGRQPDAALGKQLHRRFVDQVTVLDAAYAGLDRAPRAVGVVAMHGHVGAEAGGHRDGGAQFLGGVLGDIQRIELGRGAAARHYLDLHRAVAQLFAGCRQHLRHAVGDHRLAAALIEAQAAAPAAVRVRVTAVVAMAGGLRQHRLGGIDAGAGSDALVDRALEAADSAAGVALGREAAQQRQFRTL